MTDQLPKAKLLSSDDIQAIKDKNRLVDVVEQHVTLRRTGSRYKGLCPFHDEKTPSFTVNDSTNTWKCFGCGLGGDVIEFVMHIEGGQNFRYAAQLLAERSGIALEGTDDDTDRKDRELRQQIHEANAAAATFYAAQLIELPEARIARDFLRERKFTSDHAATYGCGYAPSDGKSLTRHLRDRGFTTDVLEQAGLVTVTKNGAIYDRFQGRLTFAIRNEFDKTIGFGARRLRDDDRIQAKFINTTETPVYRKSEVLYGYDLARTSIVKQQRAVVVEGYADVMACHAAGITTAVAACGTSFTREHLRILRRSVGDAGEITFGLDSDKAGAKATLAIYDMAQGAVRRLTALNNPDGKDPEEARRFHGDEALQRIVDNRVPLLRRVLDITLTTNPLETPEDKVYAATQAAELIGHVSDDLARREYAEHAANLIGVRAADITSRLPGASDPTITETPATAVLPTQARAEQNLLTVCVLDEATARRHFWDARNLIVTTAGRAIAQAIADAFTAEPVSTWFDRIRANTPTAADPLLLELAARELPVRPEHLFDYAQGVINQLDELRRHNALAAQAATISEADDAIAALDALISTARNTR